MLHEQATHATTSEWLKSCPESGLLVYERIGANCESYNPFQSQRTTGIRAHVAIV